MGGAQGIKDIPDF